MKNEIKRKTSFQKQWQTQKEYWIISVIALVWVGIFAYYPMYGLFMSIFEYRPGSQFINENFVGVKYFVQFFQSPDFFKVMRNTLAISFLNIVIGFPAPIIFAICLNEVKNKATKKIFQSLSYIPHFISWVVVASFMFSLFGNDGIVNQAFKSLGLIDSSIQFLNKGEYFWAMLTGANVWKSIGWSSIIYLSAMAGIDSQYYEAGAIDGLGRFGAMWYITLPAIKSTIFVLFILGIGGILNAGFEQQLLLGNDLTRDYYEVIDTYTYKYGIQLGRYSYSTAIGLMKSIIGVSLVFLTNFIGKKYLDTSIM